MKPFDPTDKFKFIKEQRKSKNLSVHAAAARVGMAKSWIWQLEKGNVVNPSVDNLNRLGQGLDFQVGVMLKDKGQFIPL